jgi:hypothetical protein
VAGNSAAPPPGDTIEERLEALGPDGTMEERLAVLGFYTLEDAGPEALINAVNAWASDYWAMPEQVKRRAYRGEAAKALTAAKVSSPMGMLDDAKADAKPKDSEASGDGSSDDIISDVDPWDEEVGGEKLLNEISATIKKYLYLPPGGPDVMALWAVFTYCWDAFDVWPILNVSSVVPGCGKSTLAGVLNALVSRPMKCEHASGPVLFRMMELHHPTLIIDEADSFLDGNEELRGICNSGNRRGGCVFRCVGDDHTPQRFSTEGPKVILGIGKRDATIYDRSISFDLQRKTDADKVERVTSIVRMEKGLLPHRRKMKRWGADNLAQLEGSDPQMPDLRTDRAHDNWRPLFAIAGLLGSDWPERVREAALAIDGRGTVDENVNLKILLLHDVGRIFEDREEYRLRSASICDDLAQMEDRPWPEWSKGKPISAVALARQLKGFKIKPQSSRFGEKTYSAYGREDLKDALSRYPVPDQVQQPQQPSNDGDKSADSNHNKDSDVVVSKPPENPYESSTVVGVVDGANGVPKKPPTYMSRLDVPAGDVPESDLLDDYETAEREAIQDEPF